MQENLRRDITPGITRWKLAATPQSQSPPAPNATTSARWASCFPWRPAQAHSRLQQRLDPIADPSALPRVRHLGSLARERRL